MLSMSLKGEEDPFDPSISGVRWPVTSSTVPPSGSCPPPPSVLWYLLGGMAVGMAITMLLGLFVWWVVGQRNPGRFIIFCELL